MKQHKSITLPGVWISFGLLLFAVILFVALFFSRDTSSLTTLDSHIWDLLEFTLYQAFLSTLLSIMIGVLLAWALSHQRQFWGRAWLIALFSSSLVLPSLVVVFGLITIYGRNGWIHSALDGILGSHNIYGLQGILLAHVYLNASYASRSLLHAFEAIAHEKYKLAKSLGFGVIKRFWYVEFPALKSTMAALFVTIFLLCFSSFAIVLILGGSPAYNTLEVAIYEAVRLEFDIALALKLAFLQLLVAGFFILLASRIKTPAQNLTITRTTLKESRMIGVMEWSIIVVFALFFISPLLAIMIDGMRADFAKILQDPLFIRSSITSIMIATVSASLTLLFSLLLADAMRRSQGVLAMFINLSGNLYLAIPSLVMGLGFFLLYQEFGGGENIWATAALIIANILMALPFALSIISPVMIKVATRYDKLCASLGISGWRRYREIELPYLLPSLAYVFALAFCFSLGDLGIIALFGNERFSTLPWYLYGLLGSYRTTDAAGVALLMMGLVLVVFWVLPRVFGRDTSKL